MIEVNAGAFVALTLGFVAVGVVIGLVIMDLSSVHIWDYFKERRKMAHEERMAVIQQRNKYLNIKED